MDEHETTNENENNEQPLEQPTQEPEPTTEVTAPENKTVTIMVTATLLPAGNADVAFPIAEPADVPFMLAYQILQSALNQVNQQMGLRPLNDYKIE